LEQLSDASFLGKLLVFPPNVRLDCKVIASYKHSSLLCLVVGDEGKKFCNIDIKLSMEFKPEAPNGILLLTGETADMTGDYLTLLLRDGHVELRSV
jgi:hypothetical protein